MAKFASNPALTQKLVRAEEASKHFRIGKSTLWQWVKRDGFPQPLKAGPKVTLFDVVAIEAWFNKTNPTPIDPSYFGTQQNAGEEPKTRGMLLRDYLAAHAPLTMQDAMQARASIGELRVPEDKALEYLAELRYAYADQMLRTRNRDCVTKEVAVA